MQQWDPAELWARVIKSQKRRLFLHKALEMGKRAPWDWSPPRDASREYVRDEGDTQGIYDTEWNDQKR